MRTPLIELNGSYAEQIPHLHRLCWYIYEIAPGVLVRGGYFYAYLLLQRYFQKSKGQMSDIDGLVPFYLCNTAVNLAILFIDYLFSGALYSVSTKRSCL